MIFKNVEELKERLVDQNYWDGHDPGEIKYLKYPEVFHLIGKTQEVYDRIVNPMIDDIRNHRWNKRWLESELSACPLELNVIRIDATKGVDDLQSQINNNQPDPKKLNVYIFEPFDEESFQNNIQDFNVTLRKLMRDVTDYFRPDGTVVRGWRNAHIIIITENKLKTKVLLQTEVDDLVCRYEIPVTP